MSFLSGYKTYIGFIAGGIVGAAWSLGWITDENASAAASLIFAWTGIAMKHAWDKAASKQ